MTAFRPATNSRAGGALKALLVLIVVGGLGALTWVTIANWRKYGEFSLRIFDPDWWTLSAPPPRGTLVGAPETVTEQAKRLATQAKDSLWGKGGLVDRAEDWWGTHVSRPATASSTAAPERKQLEAQLGEAEREFRTGLDVYKQAGPTAGGSAEDKRVAVDAARSHFRRSRELLASSLGPYEALADHDAGVARSAHQLRDYDQQLLDLVGDPR